MTYLHFQQAGSGRDVILIHGLFGSLENLNMVARELKNDFRVTSVDVRNHGNSFHSTTMSYEEMAVDIIQLMDHLGIAQAAILGHSMGGKIAMETALKHPERVSQLIIADIAPVTYPPHHQQIIKGLQAIDLSTVHTRKDADVQLAPYVEDAGVRQFLLRNLVATDGQYSFKCHLTNIASSYQQLMQGQSTDRSYSGDTVFVVGGQSNYVTSAHQELINTLFPHAKAKIIQGAGHWLHAEKTVAFNKIVRDFLAS